MAVAGAVLLVLMGPVARAAAPQAAPADSAAATPRAAAAPLAGASDSSAARAPAAAADSSGRAARRPRPRPETLLEQPRFVMLRSALVPGWGQLHNGSWLKALGVAAGETWLAVRLRDDWRALDRLERQAAAARAAGDIEDENALIDRYNARLDGSVRRQWLLAGVVTYALLDAYVDAHFRDFRFEFENDPALPGGTDRGGARVSIRWGF